MILFKNVDFDLDQCQKELDEVKAIFNGCPDIPETDRKSRGNHTEGLQTIFKKRSQLFALMGKIIFGEFAKKWNDEVKFGNYRADFIIASKNEKQVCLIEFEDATTESIFSVKTESTKTKTYEWSSRFDHGYSQILDWKYYATEEKASITNDFSTPPKKLEFALVVGWEKHLQPSNLQSRYDFRKNKVVINSGTFYCWNFDSLVEELQEKLHVYREELQNNAISK